MSRDSEKAQRTERVRMLLHPTEVALIRFIREKGYARLDGVEIHDGLPVTIEMVTQKVRLDRG